MSAHRIVLSGASGMLGRAILRQLERSEDVSVLALYRSGAPPKSLGNIEARVLDFNNPDAINEMLDSFQPTVFMQSAATGMQHPVPDAATLNEVNVELPVRLAEAASKVKGCHFVQVSSGLAYADQGRPLREDDSLGTAHPYGASKAEAEKRLLAVAQDRGMPLTILRPFSFTGEGDFGSRLFPSLLHSAAERIPFPMSTGDQVRDHASVNDIARGVIATALQSGREPHAHSIFNLGSGDTRNLRTLVSSVTDELGLEVDIQFGARPPSPQEPMFMVADITRAQDELQWKPRETVAQAVWQLARSSLPTLKVKEPNPSA